MVRIFSSLHVPESSTGCAWNHARLRAVEYRRRKCGFVQRAIVSKSLRLSGLPGEPVTWAGSHFQTPACYFYPNFVESTFLFIVRIISDQVLIMNFAGH